MTRARLLIPLAIFAIIVVFLGLGLTRDPRLLPSPLIDKPAPAFTLPALHDPTREVSDRDLTETPALLNVWASWCVACRAEHPVLLELARRGGARIIGLNYKDDRADALRWLGDLGDPYVVSAMDRDGRVGLDWGVYGVPETFVIDGGGTVRYKHVGPVDTRTLEERILPLLRRLADEAPAKARG